MPYGDGSLENVGLFGFSQQSQGMLGGGGQDAQFDFDEVSLRDETRVKERENSKLTLL